MLIQFAFELICWNFLIVVVVLAFFTSWAPYHLQRVLTASIDASTVKSQVVLDLLETLYYISGNFEIKVILGSL